MKQIPENQLIPGRWYAGRGRNANVAYWCRVGTNPSRLTFVTVGLRFHQPDVKEEGYYEKEAGCFQPFMLIDEGTITQPVGPEPGWNAHYALEMKFPADRSQRNCRKCGQPFEVIFKQLVALCPECDKKEPVT